MKKIIVLLVTALMLVNVSGCGGSKNTADSYADKLASGEIKPKIETEEGDSSEKEKNKKDKNEVKESETAKPEKNKEENSEEESPLMNEQVSDSTASMDVTESAPAEGLLLSEAELGAFIDKFDDEYKSFDVIGIPAPDFYMGQRMRLGAVIDNHQLSQVYGQNLTAVFLPEKLNLSFADGSGEQANSEYYVYSFSKQISKTPAGRDFVYVSYGSEAPQSGAVNGVIGVLTKVVCSKPESMGEAKADEYILMIESGQPETYQLFLVE